MSASNFSNASHDADERSGLSDEAWFGRGYHLAMGAAAGNELAELQMEFNMLVAELRGPDGFGLKGPNRDRCFRFFVRHQDTFRHFVSRAPVEAHTNPVAYLWRMVKKATEDDFPDHERGLA